MPAIEASGHWPKCNNTLSSLLRAIASISLRPFSVSSFAITVFIMVFLSSVRDHHRDHHGTTVGPGWSRDPHRRHHHGGPGVNISVQAENPRGKEFKDRATRGPVSLPVSVVIQPRYNQPPVSLCCIAAVSPVSRFKKYNQIRP